MKFYFLATNTIFKPCACTSLWMQITCSWLVINCLYSTSLLTHKILEQQYFILVLHSNKNSLSSFTFTAVTWKPAVGSAALYTVRKRRYFPGDQGVWYILKEWLLSCQEMWWLFTSVTPWTLVTWCPGTGEIRFIFILLGRPVRGNTCQLRSRVTECGPR